MVFDGTPAEYAELQGRGVQYFQARILAVWEVAAGKPDAPDWIERLAQAGDADRLFRHPRHNRYTSHAFFVKRLTLWQDIALHWDRRKAAFGPIGVSTGDEGHASSASAWVVVSFFASDRLRECPPEAILTIDAVNTVALPR